MRIGKSVRKLRKRHALAPGLILLLLGLGLAWSSLDVRSFASVRTRYRPSDVWVVDRNGVPLEAVRTRREMRSLDWVEWSEVSPAFRDLLVRAEDHRFHSHSGVDVLAMANATWGRLIGRSRRGASTIPMQVVGLIGDAKVGPRRGVLQKLKQIFGALKLHRLWSREQTLEAYVNLVSFRGELVGLRAASLGYLGKNPSGLMDEEAALLVALLRAPNAPADLVARRACLLLGRPDCRRIESLAQNTLTKAYRLARPRQLVPVLSKRFVENEASPSLIRTSLDRRTQELALSFLREQLRGLKRQNVNDGAVLVMESRTGRVVAYVANAGAGVASAEQIDGIQTRRQAGSTIKPFVYATAFDWQLLKPDSLLEDSPADIAIDQGRVYHPHNYDRIFRGLVGVGDALGSSMNVPAVRALQLVGESRVLDRLRALGFGRLNEDEYYGPSLALGAIDLTLWELTEGYRRFAVENTAFSDETRRAMFDILASPEHRRFTFGMDSVLTLPFPAAVKTGTSKDMRDNWCIGWTPRFTVGVWIGNFNGEPMWNVSGMSGAAPVWRALMMALHPNPQGIFTKYEPGAEPLPRRTISRIRYPASDMLVGLDPDIPSQLQKLPIEIENPQRGQRLFLNGRFLSDSREVTLWPIRRGKYHVELKTRSGSSLDSVKFQVR